jgi:hypothetical protein
VREDLGRIPTLADWLTEIVPKRWMYGQSLKLESSDDGPTATREAKTQIAR